MKIRDFALLCDENIHPDVYHFLKIQPLTVTRIEDHSLHGATDIQILEFAFARNLIVLTQDRDFGSLIYSSDAPFVGIVYLRPGHLSGNFHIETLQALMLNDPEVLPPFIIVAENIATSIKLRIRNNLMI